MKVQLIENGKEFVLRGEGWNKTRFDLLQKEAGNSAKVVVLDNQGERYLVPITSLIWIGGD